MKTSYEHLANQKYEQIKENKYDIQYSKHSIENLSTQNKSFDRESINSQIDLHSKTSESLKINMYKNTEHHRPNHYLTKKIKNYAYYQTLASARSSLKNSDKIFSKLIHNNNIESLSEIGSKTIARPKAVLGGAMLMVFGGLSVVFLAKYAGFEIPNSIFLVLYLTGFMVTVLIEIAYKLLKITK
jgi:hypothetical protein